MMELTVDYLLKYFGWLVPVLGIYILYKLIVIACTQGGIYHDDSDGW